MKLTFLLLCFLLLFNSACSSTKTIYVCDETPKTIVDIDISIYYYHGIHKIIKSLIYTDGKNYFETKDVKYNSCDCENDVSVGDIVCENPISIDITYYDRDTFYYKFNNIKNKTKIKIANSKNITKWYKTKYQKE